MHVVVIGSDVGAVRAALELSRSGGVQQITLISESDRVQRNAIDIDEHYDGTKRTPPLQLKGIFADFPGVQCMQDTVQTIEAARKLIRGNKRTYHYDKMIISRNTPPSHVQAQKKLSALMEVLTDDHAKGQHTDTEVIIVGDSVVAVEVASAYEYACRRLLVDSKSRVRVSVVTSHSTFLPELSREGRRHILSEMKRQHIESATNVRIRESGRGTVMINTRKLPESQVISLDENEIDELYSSQPLLFELRAMRRVMVSPHLEAYTDIYVIGEATGIDGASSPITHLDMADYVVDRIVSFTPLPYSPPSKLTMVAVGPQWVYLEWFGVYIKGRPAAWAHNIVKRIIRRKVLA